MTSFKFKIDEKSLYYGIKNDYERGQTATVHTPINQSSNPNKWHQDILELTRHNLSTKVIPDMLLRKCLRNTTSQAKSKITQFFEFKKLKLDGADLHCSNSFAMYIKEEIDEYIINRNGKRVKNTHFGRQKLHYPITLKFKSDGFNVDNEDVLKSILIQNGGFAFVVRGFEYDIENACLNFITSMVGPENILLSNVFKRAKGTGKKLLLEEIDANDFEIVNDYIVNKQAKITDIQSIFEMANKTKNENGARGEQIILEKLKTSTSDITDIYHTSVDYPTSPYDIEYIENGVKKYVEVKSTQGSKKVFNMSSGEIKFMNLYADNYILYLITNVRDKSYKIYKFNKDQIIKLKQEYPSTRFYA